MKMKKIYYDIAKYFSVTALIIICIPTIAFPVNAIIAILCIGICLLFMVKGKKCKDGAVEDWEKGYKMVDTANWVTYGLILILLLF